MYEAFDTFMATGTWHTDHPNDQERFNQALAKVIRNPDFDADQMGEYLRSRTHPDRAREVDHLVTNAWAVREYLKATGGL